jgi:predicted nucleic acid-binding Zn finger protein
VSLKKEDLKINLIYKHPNSMSGPNNIIYYEVILNGQNVQNISIIDLDKLGIRISGNGLIILNRSVEYTTNTPIERDEITLPNIVKIKKIISEKNGEASKKRELERIEQDRIYKEKMEKEAENLKKIKRIHDSFPSLLKDINDIILELTDLTSFSNVDFIKVSDYSDDYLKKFKQYILENPICTIDIYLNDVMVKGSIKPKSLDGWDYLSNILKKIKQIDSYLITLNNEYFTNTNLKLEVELDNWVLIIQVVYADFSIVEVEDTDDEEDFDEDDYEWDDDEWYPEDQEDDEFEDEDDEEDDDLLG